MEFLTGVAYTLVGMVVGFACAFFTKFAGKLAEAVVANMEINASARRAFFDASASSAGSRLDGARANAALSLIALMASANAKTLEFASVAYFRRHELQDGQSLEDLGRADMREVSKMSTELTRLSAGSCALVGDQQFAHVGRFVAALKDVIYDIEAAYVTSQTIHKELAPDATARISTVSNFIQEHSAQKVALLGQEYVAARAVLEPYVKGQVGAE